MATETLKLLNRAGSGMARAVGSGETDIYTCPASTVAVCKKMIICNVTATDVTVNLWHVESGVTTSDANQILNTRTIPANDSVFIDMPCILTATDTIQALCSANLAVSITLYGSEVV